MFEMVGLREHLESSTNRLAVFILDGVKRKRDAFLTKCNRFKYLTRLRAHWIIASSFIYIEILHPFVPNFLTTKRQSSYFGIIMRRDADAGLSQMDAPCVDILCAAQHAL